VPAACTSASSLLVLAHNLLLTGAPLRALPAAVAAAADSSDPPPASAAAAHIAAAQHSAARTDWGLGRTSSPKVVNMF